MARLSGIPDEPGKAPVCLGCHATAADTEKWEKDATFRLEDGVQCEKCHGPGSEYMDESVMRDREAAMKAGLRRFTKRDCEVCRLREGLSRRRPPQADDRRRGGVEGPRSPRPRGRSLDPPGRGGSSPRGPRAEDVGALACGTCHQGPMMGPTSSACGA